MISLFIRNLVFTILQPGLVAGLIPLWISGFSIDSLIESTWEWEQYAGAVVFLIGLAITLWCIVDFATKGQGTLSPADPTKKLVVSGLYRFSRNPMYVGVVLILIGEAILLSSPYLWLYTLLVFTLFNLFVMYVEEPRLKKDFGAEYVGYCQEVRRWF